MMKAHALRFFLHLWIMHEAGVAEVDLGLLARGGLHADRHRGSPEGELPPEVALYGGIANLYSISFFQ